jgi:hypothetical protein
MVQQSEITLDSVPENKNAIDTVLTIALVYYGVFISIPKSR